MPIKTPLAASLRVNFRVVGTRCPDRLTDEIVRVMCRKSLCGRGQWKPPITPVGSRLN